MPDKPAADDAAASAEAVPEVVSQELRTTSWVLPVVTAVVLVTAFCLYYFVYVRAQREYLGNRNFRSLAALGAQLQTQITIHGSILEFYADLDRKEKHERAPRRQAVDFETQILVVKPEDLDERKEERLREARKDYVKYLAPTFELTDRSTRKSSDRLSIVLRNGRWVLEFAALGKEGVIRGLLGLEDLFGPLVGALPFDDILLASEDGEIVYQSRKDGPRFRTLAALLANQSGDAQKKPAANPAVTPPKAEAGPSADPGAKKPDSASKVDAVSIHLTDIALVGTNYKLFLQPVLIDAFNDDPSKEEERHRWMLCGLRSSATLEWEAMAISYTVIIWLTVLLFAICTGGPILKIFLMNNRERLPLRQLGFLALFLVLLSGVFTLSGLQAAHFSSNDDNTARKLQKLGEDLSQDIHLELGLMRDQLVAMCHTDGLKNDLKESSKREVTRQRIADWKDDKERKKDEEIPASTKSTFDGYSEGIAKAVTKYFNFNNAFWTDDDGQQVVKWSPGDYATPFVDFSRMRAFTEPKTSYLDAAAKGPPVHIDSLLPPNRLEYLAVVSMNTQDCNAELDKKAKIRADITGGQAFLTAQPFSLIDPVLPFGYGFAVVEQTGLVLFHSDKTKNMRENFLQESEWNRALSSAVFGHSTSSLRIKYLGKDYRARVLPIAGLSQTPWSLIVYHDLTSVRTLDLQSMTMATTLFLLFLAGPFLCIAVWWVIRRPSFAPECVWPNPARMATYGYLSALYAVLIVVFLFLGFSDSAEQSTIACAAFPYTALLMTCWCFRAYRPPGERRARHGRRLLLPAVFSVMAAIVFLAALVVLWQHSSNFALLPAVAGIAAIPLLRRPRVYLVRTFRHWHTAGGAHWGASRQPGSQPFGYRAAYALSFLLLLLLIGVLTPIALFRASLSVERRLQVKQAQLHLASALEQHQRSIDDHHEGLDRSNLAYGEFFRDTREWDKMGLVPPFLSDGKPSFGDHPGEPGQEIYSGWFRRLIYALHHDYNDAATETLGVISDRPNSDPAPDWTWVDQGSSIKLVWHGAHPRAGAEEKQEHDLVITSAVPGFSPGETRTAVGIGVGVMLVIGGIFWALARKMFLFHIAPLKLDGQRQVAESLREGRNVLVLLPPVSDWQWEEDTWKLDVAQLATGPKWADDVQLDSVPHQMLIEIRHFEHTTGHPEIDIEKFLLLQLIQKKERQVVAVMTVSPSSEDYRRQFPGLEAIDLREEPFQWRAAYPGPARDLIWTEIWKECGPLPGLWPLGAQLAKDIGTEAIRPEETIASEILERAEGYYRMIWKDCSREQKFVLTQLAVDGLLNPTNERAVRQLVRQGLIAKDPQFRIVNESFRRFLATAATAELKQEWLRESRQSGWGRAHGVVFITVVLVGVFLLATQNGLLESSTGYVTTALGALATLAKGFNSVRGGSKAKAS